MDSPVDSPAESEQSQDTFVLYQHTKRKKWGLAVLAWEQGDKRGYQFEDGKLRVMMHGYFHLLEPIEVPAVRAASLLAHVDLSAAQRQPTQQKRPAAPPMTFEDQLAVFAHFHPGGFAGDDWGKKVRGDGVSKRLKRHLDPAVRDAQEQLSAEKLDELRAAGQGAEVFETVLAILGRSALVQKKQLKPMESLAEERRDSFASALRALLYGDAPFAERLAAYLREIPEAGWELATVLPALVHPQNCVCVRPSIFQQQALGLKQRIRHSRAPQADVYSRYEAMARTLREKLVEAEIVPRDNLDVYEFMWTTLRPAAKKTLAELKMVAAAEAAEATVP